MVSSGQTGILNLSAVLAKVKLQSAQSLVLLCQAMTISSVGLGLSGAWDLFGRLLNERALPGRLGCDWVDGTAAAVRAAPCCRILWSARMLSLSSAAVMSSLDTCRAFCHG